MVCQSPALLTDHPQVDELRETLEEDHVQLAAAVAACLSDEGLFGRLAPATACVKRLTERAIQIQNCAERLVFFIITISSK